MCWELPCAGSSPHPSGLPARLQRGFHAPTLARASPRACQGSLRQRPSSADQQPCLGRQANGKARGLPPAALGGLCKPSFQLPVSSVAFLDPPSVRNSSLLQGSPGASPGSPSSSRRSPLNLPGSSPIGRLWEAACAHRQISRATPPTNPAEASSGTEPERRHVLPGCEFH